MYVQWGFGAQLITRKLNTHWELQSDGFDVVCLCRWEANFLLSVLQDNNFAMSFLYLPISSFTDICVTGCTSQSCRKCPAVERARMMCWPAKEDSLFYPKDAMLVRGPPETSARIYQTLRHHFPEDGGTCIYNPPVNNDLETLKLGVWNLVGKYTTVRTRLCVQHKWRYIPDYVCCVHNSTYEIMCEACVTALPKYVRSMSNGTYQIMCDACVTARARSCEKHAWRCVPDYVWGLCDGTYQIVCAVNTV